MEQEEQNLNDFLELMAEFKGFKNYNSRSYLSWLQELDYCTSQNFQKHFTNPEYNPQIYDSIASVYSKLLSKDLGKAFHSGHFWRSPKIKLGINASESFLEKCHMPAMDFYRQVSASFYYDDEAINNLHLQAKNYCPRTDVKILEELKSLKRNKATQEITKENIDGNLHWDICQSISSLRRLSSLHFKNAAACLEVSEGNFETIMQILKYKIQHKDVEVGKQYQTLFVQFFGLDLMLLPVKELTSNKAKWFCFEELSQGLGMLRDTVDTDNGTVDPQKLEEKLVSIAFGDLRQHLKSNDKNESDFFLQTSTKILKAYNESHVRQFSNINLKISGPQKSLLSLDFKSHEQWLHQEIPSLLQLHKTEQIKKSLEAQSIEAQADIDAIKSELANIQERYELASQVYPEDLSVVWLIDKRKSSHEVASLLKALIDKKVIKVLSLEEFSFEYNNCPLQIYFGHDDNWLFVNAKTVAKENQILPLAKVNSLHRDIKDEWYKQKELYDSLKGLSSSDNEARFKFLRADTNTLVQVIRSIHHPEISSHQEEAVGIYIPDFYSPIYICAALDYLEAKNELKVIDASRCLYEHLGKTVILRQEIIPCTIQYRHIGDQDEIYACLDANGKLNDDKLAAGLVAMQEKYGIINS